MASLDHTQGGHSTSRRTKHPAKSLASARNDWPRSGEPHSRPSPRRGRHGGIESSDVRSFSSHPRQPPSVTPTTPTSSRSGSTSTTTTPDRPTISRSASMRASGMSGRGPRAATLSHHMRPICVLEEEDSDEDDNGNDDDEEEEEVVVPATFRSRSKSLHRESRRDTRSRSAHPFRSRSESRYPESRRDVSPRSTNPFRSMSQSRRGDSRRDASPRSAHPYRSTPVSRRSPRTSMSDSEHDTDASSVADDKAIQPRNKALAAVPVLHMAMHERSMHERLNRGQQQQDTNSDHMPEDTQIYHVPSVGDEQPPSHRSSQKREHYRRPRVTRDEYDDDFHRVYHHTSVDDERSRSRPKRPSRKYYQSEEFISKPASSLKRAHTMAGSHLTSSQSMASSTRRSNTFLGSFFGASIPPPGNAERFVTCVICMDEELPIHKTAKLKCRHRMCYSCLKRNFKLSVKDPQNMPPRCCADDIPLKHVESLFDSAFKQTWNKKFAEYSTRNRIYCPSTRCNEWIKPEDIRRGEDGRKYGKCGRCKAKVCYACRGRWHASSRCPRDEETNQFLEQAQREGWKRCHRCKAVVELKEGCNHMTCRCGAEFCMICGSKWKSCECPLFSFDEMDDALAHMQTPTQVNSRVFPHTTPRFSSGLPTPPSPRGFRSEPRPSATDAIRPRPSSYEEEELVRHLQEQREAHVSHHHKMPSYHGFDGHEDGEGYEREIAPGPGRRSRTDRYIDERPEERSYHRRRAATVVAPSPPPSRQQVPPPPHPSFERANTGPEYGSGATWTRGQLSHSPDRVRSPTPDRHRPASPARYRYTSPQRHPHPSPDQHHHAPDPDRLRPRSPDKRRTSSFERRLADRFNQGSRHIVNSATIGPPMGIMGPAMMAGPMSPIRPGQPSPHTHPANHPMHHHHPGPPHPHAHPPIPMAPIPPSGSAPMPPRMNMRGMEIADDFFNSNRSTRSLDPVAMPRREKDPAGGGGLSHAPTVRRRPTGQAHRDHIKAEVMPSVQAGLTGPGRGMDRVYEWRNYVEPGLPEGEHLSVVSGPGS